MKKILSIICLCCGVWGCQDDFINIPLDDSTPAETFFVSQEDALEAVNQIYSHEREFIVTAFAYTGMLDMTSDDTEKGSTPGDAAFLNDFNDFTFGSSSFLLDDHWTGQYRGINLANQVLTNVPPIDFDENLKSRFLGEAQFFRAYYYFDLVRVFGGVPIYEGLPADGNYNIPRNTADEVYDLIISDLTTAAEALPISYDSANLGRATRGAALGLLAKVQLYRENYTQVVTLTTEIEGLGYDLFPDYEQYFRVENENNIESIFEIQFTADGNCAAASQYGQHQGVRGQWGWGFNVPTEDLANAYEDGDLRRDGSILFLGETTPAGDLVTAGNNPDNPVRYNQKIYVPQADFRRNNCNENSDSNLKVLRFADILLISAEANNELGNTAAALERVNRVRNRAGLADLDITDQAALRMAIWRERRVELAMEQDRFLDLVRQGRAAEVLQAIGTQFTAGVNEIFPIPANQILLSNGVLEQNPGY